MDTSKSSRLSGFFRRTLQERIALIADWAGLNAGEATALPTGGLSPAQADTMIENVIGLYALPMGVATNFLINGRDVLVPMVIEEPSVVAALSNAARMFRAGGGFTASTDDSVMIGQMQVLDVPDPDAAVQALKREEVRLMAYVDTLDGAIVKAGGGARGIEARVLPDTPVGPMLIVHLLYDTRDAMGANAVNTAVEKLAPDIEAITGGRVNLRILSNLADRRKARARGTIPHAELATDDRTGPEVARAIVEAWAFAAADPYRAATHNKGIMNGIDALVIATGNDWRAIEAGAHSYAARSGQYTSLTRYWQNEQGDLCGEIELPMALGVVGGATRVHPTAQTALRILGQPNARTLSEIAACVGLGQNLAAIRALAVEGIQHGHMRLHARQIAMAAGATPDQVALVAQQMIDEKQIRPDRARAIVESLKGQ
jgi:hydroxymethylglutaryl-CoA reductase